MISFSSLVKGFELNNPEILKSWLKEVIQKEQQKAVGDIRYVFTDDTSLNAINNDFLDHDNFTDIITFNTSSELDIISGEIYISVERVRENAEMHQQDFEKELARVIIHGVLHLIGFKDHSAEEKAIMRTQEDYCLNLLP